MCLKTVCNEVQMFAVKKKKKVLCRELYLVLCGSLDGKGVWGEMDKCICMAESVWCAPQTITTLSIDNQFSSVVSNSLWPHKSQHARPPCPSPTPGVYPDSCPSSWWCHPAISSSVIPFSSCPQSLPASESFPMNQLFAWDGQSIGASALASVLPKNIQDWSPSGWICWTSLQSKGLSRVFSNTTVQKHQFFDAELSL